ncbi:hypothetical protein Pcinc_003896 [Petrolisthes cinctipes]|uniref:Uncharacterized protein n=1 Tax=Petrolisthes cinctipes TaxID=88211 RepID=A0AAE1GGH1_PETCI|nr:hypothetical protein Pcinc_003896 [Petrolisthes cinctipes]
MLQSPSPTNETGRHLAVLLEDIPHVRLLNTGEATYTQGGRLDLTLVSSDLAADAIWQVHPTLTSDHFTTLTSLPVAPPVLPRPPPRWNIRRADWSRFQASLDEWWADYQPPDDLHQQERDLTAAIQTAATTAIPMCAPSRRHQTDWWYYNDEVREHNHRVNLHRKLYKKRPNPNNLRLLQQVVARARQVSLRAKEDKWLEWCATFSQHTSLGQMWRSVRMSSGAAPPRPAAHPHPQQEAERLATTFTSRGSSDQLPLHTRRTQQQLQPHRDEAVREAMEVADMTDRPFSLQELQQAKRRGHDTATGADGVPYSMLAHAGPAGDTALWKNLRDTYAKDCKKEHEKRSGSGAGSSRRYYIYREQMSLKKVIGNRNTTNSLSSDNNTNEVSEEAPQACATEQSVTRPRVNEKCKKVSLEDKMIQFLEGHGQHKHDDDRVF